MQQNNSIRTYPEWIDEYAEAYRSSFMKHDVRVHMPFSGWDFFPLFADLYIDKVYGAVAAFRRQGLQVADVMDRLPNHASMKFKLSEFIYCMGIARTPP